MCGIAGFIAGRSQGAARPIDDIAAAMSETVRHRGPDDHGVWIDPDAGVALVHRRLSIVDLSPAGHQPMVSADGRFVIIYNGEIYSHRDRCRANSRRAAYRFRGHSDTEVILESIRRVRHRSDAAPADRHVRDRAVGPARAHAHARSATGSASSRSTGPSSAICFLFGSELKALRAHPGWTPRIDRNARRRLHAAQLHSRAAHDLSRASTSSSPAPMLTLAVGRRAEARSLLERAPGRARRSRASRYDGSDSELTDQLETLLTDAVGGG